MGRGVSLACEQCTFSATLFERVPFALDASNQPHPLAPQAHDAPAGYWSDALCGECRLPVRQTFWLRAPETPPAGDGERCPRCGADPLPFEDAVRELAAASHSRVWLDISGEEEAVRRLQQVLAETPRLRDAVAQGDLTTSEGLAALVAVIAAESGLPPPLEGLDALIENAFDLDAAAQLVRARLEVCERNLVSLRVCADDEAYLPGVPCPACNQGHLVHWPLWT
jgi:hypothetical protein